MTLIARELGISQRTVSRIINSARKKGIVDKQTLLENTKEEEDNADNQEEVVKEICETETKEKKSYRAEIDEQKLPPDLGEYAQKTLLANLEGLFKMLAKVEQVPGAYGQITAETTIRKEIRMTAAQIGQWAGLGKEAEVGNAILAEFSKKYLNQPLKDVKFEE